MRRTLCLLVAVAFMALGTPVFSQRAEPSPAIHLNPDEVRKQLSTHEELVDVNNETTLAKYIQAFKAASSPDDQAQLVQELQDYLVQHGLSPNPDAAEAFLQLAIEARRQGKSGAFAKMAAYAQAFDPGHPAVHMALASDAREAHGAWSPTFLFESMAALLDSFARPAWRPIAMANLALWARIASLLLLAALSLLMFFKYNSLLRHDVQEWLGSTEAPWTRAAGWIVLFLPSLLLLSGYWWIVYWSALFLLYARWPERVAVILAIGALVASGHFALRAEQDLFTSNAQPHWSNLRSYANRIDVGPDRALEDMAAEDSNLATFYRLILANRLMLHGSYIQAERLYQDVDKAQGGNPQALNNLGCIYYFEGRYQEAISKFTDAIAQRPDMGRAYFNRSVAKNKLFDFSGAKDDQEKCQSLDPALFSQMSREQSEDWVPLPVFPPLSKTRDVALTQERRSSTGLSRALSSPVTFASGILQPAFSAPILILAFLFLAVGLIKKRSFFAKACFKCGRPYCSRCKTSLEFDSFCAQCVHLYIKQDGVSPEARLKKNYEVETYNRQQAASRAILSLLAPGAGHVWEGNGVQGFFILALWCSLVSGFLVRAWGYPLGAPPSAGSLAPAYMLVASILGTIVWLVFGLLKALSRPAATWGPKQVRR